MKYTGRTTFRDRTDAARQLAERLRERDLRNPLVLAIPRGGVVIGAVLARELGAELDVVLSRKIRAPHQPEYAIGAISEEGDVTLNPDAWQVPGVTDEYIQEESRHQLEEIRRRAALVRSVRPAVPEAGRTIVITDDGIATGSTMLAALQTLRHRDPHELIVAVPVASPDRLMEVRQWCDDVICLHAPRDFWAVGQYYEDFGAVEDEDVLRLLREPAQP